MASRDYGNVIGSSIIIAFGAFVAVYAYANYQLGTVAQMGPGMVPMGVGVLLSVTGALILIPALVKARSLPKADYKAALAVVASLAGFAVSVNVVGLVLAIFILTFISSLAGGSLHLPRVIAVSVVLSIVVVLIFIVGLGMPFHPFIWPF